MNQQATHYIYGLTEPGSDTIRYIGCTSEPFRRLCQHATPRGAYRGVQLRQWLNSIYSQNKEPQMVLLDRVNNKSDARRIETDWILTLLAGGVPLTNRLYPGHENWNIPRRRRTANK